MHSSIARSHEKMRTDWQGLGIPSQVLADVANQVMAQIQTQDVHVNTVNNIINHLAIFFDFSKVDDTMYNLLCEPIRKKVEKRFRDFVRINFAHTGRSNGITEADGYNERWQQQVLKSFSK